jgi:hypothetical protein
MYWNFKLDMHIPAYISYMHDLCHIVIRFNIFIDSTIHVGLSVARFRKFAHTHSHPP